METITKYKAEDGSEWDTQELALTRERMMREVIVAMAPLTPAPEECNWEGYIQQGSEEVRQVQQALFNIADQESMLKRLIADQINIHGKTKKKLIEDTDPWWFLRLLGDYCPLARGYHRLCCIDEKFREWNQPFFVLNPSKGKDICAG